MVFPLSRITSTPSAMGLGAGFARALAPKMAMEAMTKEVNCMMNVLMVLDD